MIRFTYQPHSADDEQLRSTIGQLLADAAARHSDVCSLVELLGDHDISVAQSEHEVDDENFSREEFPVVFRISDQCRNELILDAWRREIGQEVDPAEETSVDISVFLTDRLSTKVTMDSLIDRYRQGERAVHLVLIQTIPRRYEKLLAEIRRDAKDEASDLHRQLRKAQIRIAYLEGKLDSAHETAAIGNVRLMEKELSFFRQLFMSVAEGAAGGVAGVAAGLAAGLVIGGSIAGAGAAPEDSAEAYAHRCEMLEIEIRDSNTVILPDASENPDDAEPTGPGQAARERLGLEREHEPPQFLHASMTRPTENRCPNRRYPSISAGSSIAKRASAFSGCVGWSRWRLRGPPTGPNQELSSRQLLEGKALHGGPDVTAARSEDPWIENEPQ